MIDKKLYKAVSAIACKYVENPDVIVSISSYVAGHISLSFNIWSGEGIDRKYVGTVAKSIHNWDIFMAIKDKIVDEVEQLLNKNNGIRT